MTTKTEAAARYREVADMPIHPVSRQIDGVSLKPIRKASSGLTKREHFAGLAMQGLLAGVCSNIEAMKVVADISKDKGMTDEQYIADCSLKYASALIAALSQGEGQ